MSIEQIQTQILEYAKKEKRYFIIAFVFYTLAIAGIVWLLFGTNTGTEMFAELFSTSNKIKFLNYLPYISGATMLFFLVYKILQLVKTESKINAFIGEIKNNNTIKSLNPITTYKLYIPLGKIKINLLPISYAFIELKDKKKYYLPMPSHCIQPLKNINNGVSQSVQSTWNDLK